MSYIFTRTKDRWPGRGEWRPLNADGRRSASVCCPGCGTVATLIDHTVEDTGAVMPSLVCPMTDGKQTECPKCGFHDHALLNGWPEYLASLPAFTEETCPSHVAAAHDGKICGNCGIHIDSLR